MLLSEFIDFCLRQVSQVITLPCLSLAILPGAAHPHVDGRDDTRGLEGNADRHARNILRAVARWKYEGGDDSTNLPATDGKGSESTTLDVADNLVGAA
jgi:hypothetical protein